MNASNKQDTSRLKIGGATLFVIGALLLALAPNHVHAQPSESGAQPDNLADQQARIADRYDRLEQIITRLSELSSATDPHRARLLREALSQARERDVAIRFDATVRLLEDGRLTTAANNQSEITRELQEILQLLLKENRGDELKERKEWLRQRLKDVGRIIRLQKGVKARTEGNDDADRLAKDQERIGDQTEKLSEEIKSANGQGENSPGDGEPSSEQQSDGSTEEGDAEQEPKDRDAEPGESKEGESKEGERGAESDKDSNGETPEGEPSDSEPSESSESDADEGPPSQSPPTPGGAPSPGGESSPSDAKPPGEFDELQKRIRAAQENMERAREKLEKAERDGATEDQDQAIRELEKARAELETILRQLREEEMERTLVVLEARFRRMLDMQMAIYETTVRLGDLPSDSRTHDDEIESARLSRREATIVREAEKVLALLRDEGTSVAFPEAVEQIHGDARQIVDRLSNVDLGVITQGLEEDVIAALEELIAAVQEAQQELENNRTPPGESPPPGEPGEPPLVRMLAELRMIRSLQYRVKLRTERYSKMIEGSQATDPDLIDALQRLAERQDRIEKATYDLETGRNR